MSLRRPLKLADKRIKIALASLSKWSHVEEHHHA
jgi:hypothetical protein